MTQRQLDAAIRVGVFESIKAWILESVTSDEHYTDLVELDDAATSLQKLKKLTRCPTY
jgi:hypothetical protein